jgi:hypothetical protein
MIEQVDRRILAALLPVDGVTGLPLVAAVTVRAEGCRTVRNTRGHVVLLEAPGLRAYTRSFDPPAAPAGFPKLLTLQVEAPGGRYLPRVLTLSLPLDPAEVGAGADPGPASILSPVPVELFPAPTGQANAGWAVLRATVRAKPGRERLPWAWLEVYEAAGNPPVLRGRGMADARGEALVAVLGIAPFMAAPGGGAVLTSQVEVQVKLRFDTGLTKVLDQDLGPGWQDPNKDYWPDPEALQKLPQKDTDIWLPMPANPVATCMLAAGQVLAVEALAQV